MPASSEPLYQAIAVTDAAERQHFCEIPGFPLIGISTLERQRPDEQWLLRDCGADVVGRCSLWWQTVPPMEGQRVGLIGHYAVRNVSAARQILDVACSQLASQRCTLAVGPMDGNTWQNYRLVVESGPEPPFFLEPTNPSEWPASFLERGFHVLAHYFSAIATDLAYEDAGLPDVVRRLGVLGVELRSIRLSELPTELDRLHSLCHLCFEGSFLFTPISKQDFIEQYLSLSGFVRPDLILIAEQGGRTIGFIFAVPDLLQAKRGKPIDTIIIKTLAVHPDFQGTGLGRLLAARCHEAAVKAGYRRAIHALLFDSSGARKISDRIAQPIRRYALFAKALTPSGSGG